MDKFKLVSEYRPSGDQPEAITGLVNGVNWGLLQDPNGIAAFEIPGGELKNEFKR